MLRWLIPVAVLMTMQTASTDATDPYLWLEEVTGERALAWVKQQNAESTTELARTPEFTALETRLRRILDSQERIPLIEKRGHAYYNFWRDEKNQRGLWRRTTLDEYRKPQPAWETVLDLDALAAAEHENWVWQGAVWLEPDCERVLVLLSRGGADASVVREFDPGTKAFVKDGFTLPEAKSDVSWKDRDTLFVGTDFGPGTLTASGYPRLAKEWKRGTPLTAASLVYEGHASDVAVSAMRDPTPGFERELVMRGVTFWESELFCAGTARSSGSTSRATRRRVSTAPGCCSGCAPSGTWAGDVRGGLAARLHPRDVPRGVAHVRRALRSRPIGRRSRRIRRRVIASC